MDEDGAAHIDVGANPKYAGFAHQPSAGGGLLGAALNEASVGRDAAESLVVMEVPREPASTRAHLHTSTAPSTSTRLPLPPPLPLPPHLPLPPRQGTLSKKAHAFPWNWKSRKFVLAPGGRLEYSEVHRDGSAVLKGTMVVDEVKPIKADSLAVVFIGTTTDEKGHARGHNILARAPDAPTALAWLIATPEAKAIPLVVKKEEEEAPNEAGDAATRGATTKLPAAAPHEAAAPAESRYTLDDAPAAAAAEEKSAAEGGPRGRRRRGDDAAEAPGAQPPPSRRRPDRRRHAARAPRFGGGRVMGGCERAAWVWIDTLSTIDRRKSDTHRYSATRRAD